jgi:hypothetical protein
LRNFAVAFVIIRPAVKTTDRLTALTGILLACSTYFCQLGEYQSARDGSLKYRSAFHTERDRSVSPGATAGKAHDHGLTDCFSYRVSGLEILQDLRSLIATHV